MPGRKKFYFTIINYKLTTYSYMDIINTRAKGNIIERE